MNKLPEGAKVSFEVPELPHNLLSGPELADGGCTIWLDQYGAEIELEGETLYKGWRDKATRLWSFNIDPNDGSRLIPLPDNDILDTKDGAILSTMEFDTTTGVIHSLLHESTGASFNALYECQNKKELTAFLLSLRTFLIGIWEEELLLKKEARSARLWVTRESISIDLKLFD